MEMPIIIGEIEKAIADIEQVTILDPSDKKAIENLALLRSNL